MKIQQYGVLRDLRDKLEDYFPSLFMRHLQETDSFDSTLLMSQICTQEQLESELFQNWAERLGEERGRLHRKIWEYCFIAHALYERKMLQPGISGLGFAVGKEPQTSLFCSLGVSVYATDLFPQLAKEFGWVDSNEHASGIAALNSRGLCSDEMLRKHCTFRHVDMNDIPNDLTGFDFIWSSCSLEHLGSIAHGERFIYNAMNCLKPNGIAVHTTEYNTSSNSSTMDHGGTVLFRRKDIQRIIRNLRREGHKINIDFSLGTLPGDSFVDVPPFTSHTHLKLQLEQYVATSIGLIIQKSS